MRQTRQEQDNGKKGDNRLLGVAGGIFVLALCGIGGFSYRQQQAAQSEPAPTPAQGHSVPNLTPDEKTKYVERAKFLRAKFEPWVRTRRVEIKRMMAAKPDDTAALQAVWKQVPHFPDSIGVTAQDLMPSGDPGVGVGFGWVGVGTRPDTRPNSKPDPRQQEMAERVKARGTAQLQDDFKERRDICLSASSGGLTMTKLWISGRITQVTELEDEERLEKMRIAQVEGRRLSRSDVYGPVQEVAPPYDFLTTPTTS